jgi:molybdate/tungstate transport system substrate-binding protein
MNFSKLTICLIGLLSISFLIPACRYSLQNNSSDGNLDQLVIFHAGSLSIPVKEIAEAFNKTHPEIKIITESAGSVACARKITDLNKACDVLLSADYQVIDNFLIPKFAGWNIRFASNEMVLVYTDKSKCSDEINSINWPAILLRKDVFYGRSDPNSDPCGYRTVISLKLAGKYLSKSDLFDEILDKDQRFIRPKEVDLVALLQSNAIDYVFIYRSVALQHQLPFLNLPDSINLGNPELAGWYASVSTKIEGNKPGETTLQKGEPMVYGLTIPKNSPNPKLALEFVKFLLSAGDGMKIMAENGQPSLVPTFTTTYSNLPESLKLFALSH